MHITNSFFQVRVYRLRHEHNPQLYHEVRDQEDEAFVKQEVQQVRHERVPYDGEKWPIPDRPLLVTFYEAPVTQKYERDGNAAIGSEVLREDKQKAHYLFII